MSIFHALLKLNNGNFFTVQPLGTANEENYQINLDLIQITDSIEF